MSTKEQSKAIINLARKGRLDGEGGLRTAVLEAVRMQIDLNYSEKPFFRSAIWEATWKNNEGAVKLLAEKGAQLDFQDYQKRTPLHEAAFYGHYNLVEFFLDKGHPIDPVDEFGQTPLFRAVEGCRHQVVELLIKRGAQTNSIDTFDVTVQHCAAFQGMPQMSEWLLYKGAWKNRFALVEASDVATATSPRAAEAAEEADAKKAAATGVAAEPPKAAEQ